MINFEEIPKWWAVCQNGACKMAETCLRHLAYRSLPAEVTEWPCVLPIVMKNDTCVYYQKPERVRMARGLGNLYDLVRNRHTRHLVRLQLTEYLGSKGTYYRYQHGERLLTPEQQAWIQELIKTYGNGEEVNFEFYIEGYDFHKLP